MLAALLASAPAPRGPAAQPPGSLFVRETRDAVRLHVRLPEGVDPGSVEVRLAGREVTVLARDAAGAEVRLHPPPLERPVTEEGATAEYEGDGWLLITLRRPRQAPPPAP